MPSLPLVPAPMYNNLPPAIILSETTSTNCCIAGIHFATDSATVLSSAFIELSKSAVLICSRSLYFDSDSVIRAIHKVLINNSALFDWLISYKKTKADVETYIFKAYNLILNINIIL